MLKPIRFPFDKSGRSPNNFVQDEPHVLLTGRERRVIVPNYIPFYVNSLIITDTATGQSLDSSDYYCADFRETIQREVGKEVASTIIVTRKSVSDNVTISYQVVGGDQSLSSAAVLREQLNTLAADSRPVVFDAIVGKPSKFAPTPHPHDIGDIYGFEYLVYAIDRLRDAIANGDADKFLSIYQYIDQQDDGLLKLILKNKQGIADNVTAIAGVQDNLDDLRMKIYGTKDRSATKVIGSFMPPSPRVGNILSWDKEHGGYYVGNENPNGKLEVYIDKIAGEDVPLNVDPTRGYSPDKPFKSLDFAIHQHLNNNGFTIFYCHGNQEHEIPNTGTPRRLKPFQSFLFNSYMVQGNVVVKGDYLANVHGLDSLNSFIRERAATIVLGDSRDTNDTDGFGYRPGKRIFDQYNYLYDPHLGFSNVKIIVKDWNINNIVADVEKSSLPEEIKENARRRKRDYYESLIGVSRVTLTNTHLITGVQNREGQNHISLFGSECYLFFNRVVRVSGKMWNLHYTADHKSGFSVVDPNLVFVDDGTRCTKPTPIHKGISYVIDYLDCGDRHYHFANLDTNIRPDYATILEPLEPSDGYLDGSIDCLPYKINITLEYRPPAPNNPGPHIPTPTPEDNTIGVPYFDENGRIFVRNKQDKLFYQIYPAIWHGDSAHPGQSSITGSQRATILYRHRDYGRNKGIRGEFIAFNDNKSKVVQVWPPVWQDNSGELPQVEYSSNTNPPRTRRAYLYLADNRWYVATIDKSDSKVVYPARWETDRNKIIEPSKIQEEHNPPPSSGPNTTGYFLRNPSMEFGPDDRFRAFRRVVEVWKNGTKYSIVKSNYLQYKDGTLPVGNELDDKYKPSPSLNQENGNVTWDYAGQENHSAISGVSKVPALKYTPPPVVENIGFCDNKILFNNYAPILIDPFLSLKYEEELLQYFDYSPMSVSDTRANGRSKRAFLTVDIANTGMATYVGSGNLSTVHDTLKGEKAYQTTFATFGLKYHPPVRGVTSYLGSDVSTVAGRDQYVRVSSTERSLRTIRVENDPRFYQKEPVTNQGYHNLWTWYSPMANYTAPLGTTNSTSLKFERHFATLPVVGSNNYHLVLVYHNSWMMSVVPNKEFAVSVPVVVDIIKVPVASVGNNGQSLTANPSALSASPRDDIDRDYLRSLNILEHVVKDPKYQNMKFYLSPYY